MNFSRKSIIGLAITFIVGFAGITSFIFISNITYPQNTSESPPPSPKPFETQIQEFMTTYNIPSLAAGIVINDSLIWANGFGDQNATDTVYMIGSITKSFTATALLQLYESNLLNISDDINNYLPFSVRHPNYSSTPITIHMLLTHTAGLPTNLAWSLEWYFNNQTIKWIRDHYGWDIVVPWDDRPSLGEFLNESLTPGGLYYDSYNWRSQPGEEYHYSNAGYQLLGYLVEAITNQSIVDYVETNIMEPLNMTNSGYYYSDFVGMNAIPYEWRFGEIYKLPFYDFHVLGAGSIRSTVMDMVNYMIFHMNKGNYNGIQLLKPETINLMHTIKVYLEGHTAEGYVRWGYGYGWSIYHPNMQGHSGAVPGFISNMVIKDHEQGNLGVIILLNRGLALTYDSALLNIIIPEINEILLDRAVNLFQQALNN